MGKVKKVGKSIGKAVKKVAKGAVKVVKGVASGIGKAVKGVVKGIAKVGKSVLKGVSKALGKLGPIASIALMAIPGFQPFAAGLASSLGFTSTFAANVATGALSSFIVSGGDLKATLTGGLMAGAGSYLGSLGKGVMDTGTLAGGFAQANAAAMAPSALSQISGGATGWEGFKAGLSQAKAEWGSFTTKVGDFLSGGGKTDIATGANAQNLMAENPNLSYEDAMTQAQKNMASVSGPGTTSTVGGVEVVNESYFAGTDQMVAPGAVTSPIDTNWSGQVKAGQDAYYSNLVGDTTVPTSDSFFNAKFARINDQIAKEYGFSLSADYQNQLVGMTPQARASLAEQWYAQASGDPMAAANIYTTADWAGQMKQMAPYNVGAANVMGTTTQAASSLRQPAQPTAEYDTSKLKDLASGLLSMGQNQEGGYTLTQPDVIDDKFSFAGLTSAGGKGGMGGFSDITREYQSLLVSQAERQAEEARKRALSGWGIA